ncbi:hypothetical protein [Actinopolymorpha sp. B9G3]|uniref:hypothetical protein n=1 Tax=Actinopolymorpha sp. B9G3 TaxID=3158970 RepID=UPI0032D966E9
MDTSAPHESPEIDWSRQSLLFGADLDVRSAAAMVGERLEIDLLERTSESFGVGFHGDDATGGAVSVSENRSPVGVERLDNVESERPAEPTAVYVHSTGMADAIVLALTGPPFRLHSQDAHPSVETQLAHAAWRRLLPQLRAQGWEVELTCATAPVQLEGRVPTGETFYYRCRWQTCSLDMCVSGDSPDWEGEVDVDGGEFAASWLEPDEAVRILLQLHAQWRSETS